MPLLKTVSLNVVVSSTAWWKGSWSGVSALRKGVKPRVCSAFNFSGLRRRAQSSSLSTLTGSSSAARSGRSVARRSSSVCATVASSSRNSSSAFAFRASWRCSLARSSSVSSSDGSLSFPSFLRTLSTSPSASTASAAQMARSLSSKRTRASAACAGTHRSFHPCTAASKDVAAGGGLLGTAPPKTNGWSVGGVAPNAKVGAEEALKVKLQAAGAGDGAAAVAAGGLPLSPDELSPDELSPDELAMIARQALAASSALIAGSHPSHLCKLLCMAAYSCGVYPLHSEHRDQGALATSALIAAT
eukprot:3478564-Prymnesium_polylepis.1